MNLLYYINNVASHYSADDLTVGYHLLCQSRLFYSILGFGRLLLVACLSFPIPFPVSFDLATSCVVNVAVLFFEFRNFQNFIYLYDRYFVLFFYRSRSFINQ